ncbi:MAG: YlxR family protein [Acidimicrobiia bacterium]|nr:YlxR family protein [Acidimicrobiia bacterium]
MLTVADPIRTCVGCRTTKPASELMRVTVPNGEIRRGGPSAGRGAWVCSDNCLEAARTSGRLNRALRLN